ncbi:MAG: hypothetical protein DYG89_45990 [Caldilinea sp. CFX5]|nr:hypothetical protein [Caldilinea sp. CFX5]
MTETTKSEQPIGYWLKRADQVLTEAINNVQAVHNFTRTDWQVLNLLREKGRTYVKRESGAPPSLAAGRQDAGVPSGLHNSYKGFYPALYQD